MIEAVKVEGLSYSYSDGTKALEGIDLTIYKGEKVVVVGPNGAGKTTFFLHLNGTIKNPAGNITVFGRSISEMRIEERIHEVGVVFQDPDDQLFMPTVFDDVAFGPVNMGLEENEVKKRVIKALLKVGLEGFETKVPHNLSYGQKKRLALAAVLSMEPKVLVLDEPTANLDPKSRADFISLINELNERDGITTIIAMHDVNALPELANRVYVLNRRIVAEGSPRKIFSDWELLRENNLEAPDVFKLFKVLNCFGYSSDDLPLSFDEAIQILTRTIEGKDGHIHLHVHEHTHKELSDVVNSYNHHRNNGKK
ncbi:energy-coupling factor ABC transporter ATP-binding protein [Methanolobus halotolerans]|uniref:Energy-coupling factor ABC transporter ATP-binding protein n=1 Tax=Methanolobus halotolerans TaxID=2052935 RepID=A0A4E0QX85_9EURY|nr:ABC transporter ATP-binding protein [Methanolobus halotolerans]TGC07279.1 energy-coupling factor ABC transporter ATP-binding protein [Methanolobus halotolerans]